MVWHTDDRFLCLSAVLEEFVKPKAAGGHSGGILIGDPLATGRRRLYSRGCGPDPPDHFPFQSWPLVPGTRLPFWGWASLHDFLSYVVECESASDRQ